MKVIGTKEETDRLKLILAKGCEIACGQKEFCDTLCPVKGLEYEVLDEGDDQSQYYIISDIRNNFTKKTKNDRRYPVRIGRTCHKPNAEVGYPMVIYYISNSDGTDYSGYSLTTSAVTAIEESEGYLLVKTKNSLYEFKKAGIPGHGKTH